MRKQPCEKERIIDVYINSDLSLLSAAMQLGCNSATLCKWMKIYGISAKPRFRFGVKKGAKFAILGNKEWLAEQLKTKSFRDLAKEIGTTEGNISDRVKRYGLRPVNWSHSLYTREGLKKKFPNGRFGKESSNWKDETTKLYNSIRTNKKAKEWRDSCLNRDKHTCQKCGETKGRIEVHHIKQVALVIKMNNIKTTKEALLCAELWNINNGQTLCRKCHEETESHNQGRLKD